MILMNYRARRVVLKDKHLGDSFSSDSAIDFLHLRTRVFENFWLFSTPNQNLPASDNILSVFDAEPLAYNLSFHKSFLQVLSSLAF